LSFLSFSRGWILRRDLTQLGELEIINAEGSGKFKTRPKLGNHGQNRCQKWSETLILQQKARFLFDLIAGLFVVQTRKNI